MYENRTDRLALYDQYQANQRRKRRRTRRILRAIPKIALLFAVIAVLTAFISGKDKPEADKSVPNEPVSAQGISQTSDISGPITTDAWKLTLVNPWNKIAENYSVQTVTLSNGLEVDERCYPDLQDMMDACRADGLSPVICSAYRTWEYQEQLFQAKVASLVAEGCDQSSAEIEAGKVVAVPGTSEHQLGLALDIVDLNNQLLDESQEDTAVQKWLMEHSWEYGFILRYPTEKSDITGIIYEPWHYRYVGKEDAERIHTLGITLEEYLNGAY